MKNAFFALVGLLFALTPALAQRDQQARTATERAERQTQQLVKQLGLNAQQTTQVQALGLARAQQVDSLRASGDRAGLRQLRGLQDEYETSLKAILTTDQWTTYGAFKEEQKARMKSRRGNR